MTTVADAYRQLGELVKQVNLLFSRIAEGDAAEAEVQLRVATASEALKSLRLMIQAPKDRKETDFARHLSFIARYYGGKPESYQSDIQDIAQRDLPALIDAVIRFASQNSLSPDIEDNPLSSLHPRIRAACESLFKGKYYRQGVLDAAFALRNLVREKSGLNEPNDSSLMGAALSNKDPHITLADLGTETGVNIQRGYMLLAQGIVSAIRNPLSHEPMDLDAPEAMEMVALISLVARRIDAGRGVLIDVHEDEQPIDAS